MLNAKQLAKYLRVHDKHIYRSLRNEWKDMPRKKVFTGIRNEYRFNIKKVMKYLEDKFNK